MKKKCDKCIHNDICLEWAHTSGIPFVNYETCGYYQNQDEKLQPKQVKQIYSDYNGAGACGYCPNCGNDVIIKNTFVYNHRIKKGHFCEWCGQSLDWGEEPFRNIGSFKSFLLSLKESTITYPLVILYIVVIIIILILQTIIILA